VFARGGKKTFDVNACAAWINGRTSAELAGRTVFGTCSALDNRIGFAACVDRFGRGEENEHRAKSRVLAWRFKRQEFCFFFDEEI
jgi:hypothetical protein